MPDTYDYITLLCRLKAAQTRIKELESGERYIHLRELEQAKRKAEQELKKMEKRALDAEKQRDDALDKAKEIRLQYYETAAELEEERGKNLKLRAQINRDYENSSIPSSKSIKRKKIANSRKKQDGNRAVSRGIPATAEKNRNPHSRSSFFLHLKKSWKTVISKRPEEQS